MYSLVLKGVAEDGDADTVKAPARPETVPSIQEEGHDSSNQKSVKLDNKVSQTHQRQDYGRREGVPYHGRIHLVVEQPLRTDQCESDTLIVQRDNCLALEVEQKKISAIRMPL